MDDPREVAANSKRPLSPLPAWSERPRDHFLTPHEIATLRADFPPLAQEIRPGYPLAYLDSAATSLKPRCVIDAVNEYNSIYPANVHRGLHTLSERATEAYETTREDVARFINAPDSSCVVFTRGTTESINLVAQSWARTFLKAGDEILLTPLEHHSNLVPWQLVAQQVGVKLVFTDLTDDGRVPLEFFEKALTERTRLVAVTGMSNVLGTVLPIPSIVKLAHERGARVLVDGAQSIPHRPTDVTATDIDFLAFSGHKVYGPTGVGVLYAKRELLEAMPPFMGGGSMVLRVEPTTATWTDVPWKFEAGTPPIAQVIGLGAALAYLQRLGLERLVDHEHRVTTYAHRALAQVPGVRLLGPDVCFKGGILGMDVEGVHPHDLASLVDEHGVAIRAGHHCAMPLHTRLKLIASARASLAFYNTFEDIDRLARAIDFARERMSRRKPAIAASRGTSKG